MTDLKAGQPAEMRQKKIILFSFILLTVMHVIFTFAGFYGNDDINYARYAAGIAHNGISLSPAIDQYQLRWSTVYSTAFFYWLFGINAFTSTLSSVISFALCGILLHKILRYKKLSIYFLAMILFFFGRSVIFYSHRLLPDPTMCFAVCWMYYSYRSYSLKKQRYFWYGIQFFLALSLALITKETIIIAFPLFIVFFLKDIFKKQHFQFWTIVIPLSLLFLFAYLLFFKITTGNFFYRYSVLVNKSYFNECSFDKLPFIDTLKRIGYELWRAMLLNGDFLVLLPGIASVIYRKKIEFTGIKKIDIFSFLFLLGCANFMTISFSSYVPLCQSPRHFLFLFPFAAITGAPMLYAYFKQPKKFILLLLLFALATAIIFIIHGGSTKYLYLLFTLLLFACYVSSLIKIKMNFYRYFLLLFAALFFTNYLVDFVKPLYPYYWDQKEIIQKNFEGKNINATLFSADELSGELSESFLKFETGHLKIYPMDSVKIINKGTLYYLLNRDLNPVVARTTDSLMLVKKDSSIYLVDRKNNVCLYEVNNEILQVLEDDDPKTKSYQREK